MSDQLSFNKESDIEEKFDRILLKPKKKKMHWMKKPFVPSMSTFTESLPPPTTNTELELIDNLTQCLVKNRSRS